MVPEAQPPGVSPEALAWPVIAASCTQRTTERAQKKTPSTVKPPYRFWMLKTQS